LMQNLLSLIWSNREIKKTNTMRLIEWLESNPKLWRIPTTKISSKSILRENNKKLKKENTKVII